jgi:hypothetical protein
MEIKLNKVDNGYILQVTKRDPLTGSPEVSLTVHSTLDEAIEKLKKA